ncbi:MAG: hypothetical protein Q4G71_09985 [Pseudomonadota bacterium]|nr:hypothetical protein [Pseudomonadota bacterium]
MTQRTLLIEIGAGAAPLPEPPVPELASWFPVPYAAPQLGVPGGYTVTALTDAVLLQWIAVPGQLVRYQIEAASDADGSPGAWSRIAETDSTRYAASVPDATARWWRVRAISLGIPSDWTDAQRAIVRSGAGLQQAADAAQQAAATAKQTADSAQAAASNAQTSADAASAAAAQTGQDLVQAQSEIDRIEHESITRDMQAALDAAADAQNKANAARLAAVDAAMIDAQQRVAAAKQAMQAQVDVVAAQVADILEADHWQASRAYPAGDLVQHQGGLYRAKQAVPAGVPTSNADYWDHVGDYASLGEAVSASLSIGYANATDIDVQAGRLTAVESNIDHPSTGLASKLAASAISDYYTKTQTDGVAASAAAGATTALKSSLEGAGGSIKAAQDAANAANTLAGGKGKVLVQSAAPGAADRNAQTLWIDTTNNANTPKRWVSGTTWQAVSDKAATDALAAANAANLALGSKLDASAINNYYTKTQTDGVAASAASGATTALKSSLEGAGGSIRAAQDAANAANTLAGGKGKVLVQSAAPGAADRNAQTLWIDTTNNANTPKRWVSGTTWQAVSDKAATDALAAANAANLALGSKLDASAINNYYTKTQTDGVASAAAAGATDALKAAMEAPTGSVGRANSAITDVRNTVVESNAGGLLDPGFELGTGWGSANVVDTPNTTLPAGTNYRTDIFRSGSRSIRFEPNSGTVNLYANTWLRVNPGDRIEVRFWVRMSGAVAASGLIRATVRTFSPTRGYVAYQVAAGSSLNLSGLGTAWQEIAGEYIVPEGVRFAQPAIQCQNPNANHAVYVDDAHFSVTAPEVRAAADRIATMESEVRHPNTGLSTRASQTDVSTLKSRVDANGGIESIAQQASTLTAQVNHPTTGLPAAHAGIAQTNTALASERTARADAVMAVQARIDGDGGANLWINGDFELPNIADYLQTNVSGAPAWTAVHVSHFTSPTSAYIRSGRGALRINANGGNLALYLRRVIYVTPGDRLHCRLHSGGFSTPNAGATVRLGLRCMGKDGAFITNRYPSFFTTPDTNWMMGGTTGNLDFSFEVPADCYQIIPFIYIGNHTQGTIFIDDVEVIRLDGVQRQTADAMLQLQADVDAVDGVQKATAALVADAGGRVSAMRLGSDGRHSHIDFVGDVARFVPPTNATSGMELRPGDGGLLRQYGSGYQRITSAVPFGSDDLTSYYGPNVGAANAKKANARMWEDVSGNIGFSGLIVGAVIGGSALTRDALRIHCGADRRAPFTIRDSGQVHNASSRNSTVTLAGFTAPGMGSGYNAKRFAAQRMDCFLEAKINADGGWETIILEVQIDSGAWQQIGTVSLDCNYRNAMFLEARYTSPDAWSTLAFRARTTSGHTHILTLKAEVLNYNESGNPPHSWSGQNTGGGGGGGAPPPPDYQEPDPWDDGRYPYPRYPDGVIP